MSTETNPAPNTQPLPSVQTLPPPPPPLPPVAPVASALPPPPPAGPTINPADFINSVKERDAKIAALEGELNTWKSKHSDSEKTFQSQQKTIENHKKFVASIYETRYNSLKEVAAEVLEEQIKYDDFINDPLEGINKINMFEAVYKKAVAAAEAKLKVDTTAAGAASKEQGIVINSQEDAQRRMRELRTKGLQKPQ